MQVARRLVIAALWRLSAKHKRSVWARYAKHNSIISTLAALEILLLLAPLSSLREQWTGPLGVSAGRQSHVNRMSIACQSHVNRIYMEPFLTTCATTHMRTSFV